MFFKITKLLIYFFFYIKSLFLKEAHRFFLVLLHFRMFPPLKIWMKVTFILLSSSLLSWWVLGNGKRDSYTYLCTNICPQKEILIVKPGFLKWKFQSGGVPTETIPPFLLALLQTNVQSHPSPASTDTYAWFQKGWRSRVLKEVTLRHKIKHIQKSEQDQKKQQLYPGIP